MKRRLAVLAALLAAVAAGWTWDDRAAYAAGPAVYVMNESTAVSDAEIADALPAFQFSVTQQLARWWGTDATLVLADAPKGAWSITVMDYVPCFACYGFHDVVNGAPVAYVGANPDEWQVTFTHELQEMLVDPWINRFARAGGRMWLVEVSDPVEALSYRLPAASGAPVEISDFILPSWYGGKRPFDLMGRLRKPMGLLPGGYASYWDNGWQQVSA